MNEKLLVCGCDEKLLINITGTEADHEHKVREKKRRPARYSRWSSLAERIMCEQSAAMKC